MTENYPVHAKDPLAEVAAKVLSYQGSPAMAPPILTPVSQMSRAFAAEVARLTSDREQARSIAVTLEQENARLRELAQKLVDGWKQASGNHAEFAESKVMDEYPGLADKQEGRSLQLLDCADELADVLNGEDPDDWGYGVGIDVIERDERDATAGTP